ATEAPTCMSSSSPPATDATSTPNTCELMVSRPERCSLMYRLFDIDGQTKKRPKYIKTKHKKTKTLTSKEKFFPAEAPPKLISFPAIKLYICLAKTNCKIAITAAPYISENKRITLKGTATNRTIAIAFIYKPLVITRLPVCINCIFKKPSGI